MTPAGIRQKIPTMTPAGIHRKISTMTPRKRYALFLSLVLVLAVPAPSAAEEAPPDLGSMIHRSIPPPGARTHVVIPGERFRVSSFNRWFYGRNYRDLWTTPIEVQVLDLDRVGGGLTPLRTGGFGQSISLHFTGQDGRRYTVRSLDKDATRRVPDFVRETVVGEVLQDLISAMLPTGALVVDPLMEAAGILHSKHALVVIPDDPRLGEYRASFAGLIGLLQEHPSEGPDDTPGFAGSRKVSGTDSMRDRLEDGPCDRVDARAFLKARLMDFLIGDKDRHHGQWRWARFPAGDCHTWLPIPEDRDQAFIDFDGFAMALARGAIPIQIRFEDTYPNPVGLTMTGWELDREFLAELDRAAWDSVVAEFRTDLPDSVIEGAVRRLPSPYYEGVGPALAQALKSRRDALPDFADRYYELISRQAEIRATDRDEYLHCEHLQNGNLVVRIGLAKGAGGERTAPYFERMFHAEETREVRIALRGGDDRAEVSGTNGRISVRIDGGGGDDAFVNASEVGTSKTAFYDSRGKNRFVEGNGAHTNERPYRRPPATHTPNAKYALDWGMLPSTIPIALANWDLGAFLGVFHSRQYFGYRRDPFAARHSFRLGIASSGLRPFAAYTGTFRRLLRDLDATVHLEFSGIETVRFTGFGNNTPLLGSPDFYKVEQRNFVFAPAIEFRREQHAGGTKPRRSGTAISLGPIVKYSSIPLAANDDKYIASLDGPLYGMGSFGQAGAQGRVEYDTRNNPAYPTSGLVVRGTGVIYPGVWDAKSAFGTVEGTVQAYLTARIPTTPTLALRAGGKKVWGSFPFHESAFLGGPGFVDVSTSGSQVRGVRKGRFAGDSSVYANAELRFAVAPLRLLMPGEFGVFLGADTGRVFFAGDPADADTWHTGVGGGFWLSFLQRRQSVSVSVMDGTEMTGLSVRSGFLF